jgi:RNA polymerase sigma-54 factor
MSSIQQGLFQSTELRQELSIAPQQIQSLEILTAPLLDLQTRINQEMAENPALERLASEGEQLAGDPMEDVGRPETDQDIAGMAAEKDEFIASLMQLDDSWGDYLPPDHARSYAGQQDAERRQYFFDSLTADRTLADDLLEQLRTGDYDEETARIGEAVIGSLDGAGYLRSHPEDVAIACGAKLDEVKRAVKMLQGFEPPGVCARDIRECLLLQLERQGRKDTLTYKAVDKYLDKLAKNRIPEVAKALRVSPAALYEVMQEIRQLQPRPGHSVDTGTEQYVLPEVYVEKESDEYTIRTNGNHMPRIRVSPLYIRLLEDPETPKEVRDYIKEKILNGNALIKSLAQRLSTIERIAGIIVDRQKEFLDIGEESMRPLTMSQVANEIGVHETTVSRAIANKYMQTPRGLFAFKHFFTTGYRTADGDMLSSHSIKSKIQALVGEEDLGHPLSDQKIVKLLTEQGLKVARRTVAKYREEIGIQSSHLRKSYTA